MNDFVPNSMSTSTQRIEPFLTLNGLTKRFGGLTAVDKVTADFTPGLLHAIIGPNGAGKTTLFNVISGFLRCDGGSAVFQGVDLVNRPTHKIAQAGVIRTLQVKSVFNGLTARENVQIAAQSKANYLHPARSWSTDANILHVVDRVIEEMDLSAIANQSAGTLSYGDVALLEIAMAVALEPKLLLLDEPICGMSPKETERSVGKIIELSKKTNVILIEHDMDVVFEIADLITVMAQGRVLARGSANEVAANPLVREAYLGPDE